MDVYLPHLQIPGLLVKHLVVRTSGDPFSLGVASGDPDSNSVLFWTRHPSSGKPVQLTLEVAEDELFERVAASAPVTVSAEAGWTCRVLVGGLKPARVYWYRFSDSGGNGIVAGRTGASVLGQVGAFVGE